MPCALGEIAWSKQRLVVDIHSLLRLGFTILYLPTVILQPQYVFIHDALLEAIECGVTEVPARELQEQYRLLADVDVETKKTGLAMEFEKVESTIHRKLRRTTGSMHYNKPKNRYGANMEAIPCE